MIGILTFLLCFESCVAMQDDHSNGDSAQTDMTAPAPATAVRRESRFDEPPKCQCPDCGECNGDCATAAQSVVESTVRSPNNLESLLSPPELLDGATRPHATSNSVASENSETTEIKMCYILTEKPFNACKCKRKANIWAGVGSVVLSGSTSLVILEAQDLVKMGEYSGIFVAILIGIALICLLAFVWKIGLHSDTFQGNYLVAVTTALSVISGTGALSIGLEAAVSKSSITGSNIAILACLGLFSVVCLVFTIKMCRDKKLCCK